MAFLFYFEPVNHICYNGKFLPAGQPVLLPDNRGYRYGDGIFETMKLSGEKILLENYHVERLFSSLALLKYQVPATWNVDKLRKEILQLCRKNNCGNLARVRLSVSRGNGGLNESAGGFDYLVEAWPLDESVNQLNENGLVIGVFPHARKSCDSFSHLKSASFLPYAMAAVYARENKLNDCLVLNTSGRIADSTIANIFLVKKDLVLTPPLSEACVDGVMRRWLLESGILQQELQLTVRESPLSIRDLVEADEIFLTNAIRGVRWVGRFGDQSYKQTRTTALFRALSQTIAG